MTESCFKIKSLKITNNLNTGNENIFVCFWTYFSQSILHQIYKNCILLALLWTNNAICPVISSFSMANFDAYFLSPCSWDPLSPCRSQLDMVNAAGFKSNIPETRLASPLLLMLSSFLMLPEPQDFSPSFLLLCHQRCTPSIYINPLTVSSSEHCLHYSH